MIWLNFYNVSARHRAHANAKLNAKPVATQSLAPPLTTKANKAAMRTQQDESPDRPVLSATDPRWTLAIMAQQRIKGGILAPPDRDRLLHVGQIIGLRPFDCHLIIAIVQDRLRRGETLQHAAPSLAMITEPQIKPSQPRIKTVWLIGYTAMVLLGELLLAWKFW